MTEAFNYLFVIYNRFINFVFETLNFSVDFFGESFNLNLGWILLVIFMIGLILKSLLNLPKSVKDGGFSFHEKKKKGG